MLIAVKGAELVDQDYESVALDLNLYLSSNLSTTTVDGSAINLFSTAVIAVIPIKQKIAQTRITKTILK